LLTRRRPTGAGVIFLLACSPLTVVVMTDLYPPVRNKLVIFLFALGITLYIGVSGSLMTVLGIPYGEPIGNPAFKIHMASYLLSLTFLLAHCLRGNPVRSMAQSISRHKPIAFYLLVTTSLLVYSVLRYGASGAAFIIDALIMPAVAALLMLLFDETTRKRIFFLVVWLIVLNSVIAVIESIFETHLIPYTIGGREIVSDLFFRSTALLGHPLKNALITGTVLVLALGLQQSTPTRVAMLAVMIMALVSFGGRAGFVLALLVIATFSIKLVATKLIHGRYTYLRIMGGVVGVVFVFGMLVSIVLALDIGERLFTKLVEWDNSASVRVSNWDALDLMSVSDVIFGISPTAMESIVYRLSLKYDLQTIENFWLALLMQLGAVGLVPFIVALLLALRYMWKRAPATGKLAIVFFMIVASSNNALSSKNIALTVLFVGVIGASAYARQLAASRQQQRPPQRAAQRPPPRTPPYRRPVRALA
jgi:O-antigen ligase